MRASLENRAEISPRFVGGRPGCGCKSLSATRRSSLGSIASQTAPIPPAPSCRTSVNRPRRCPDSVRRRLLARMPSTSLISASGLTGFSRKPSAPAFTSSRAIGMEPDADTSSTGQSAEVCLIADSSARPSIFGIWRSVMTMSTGERSRISRAPAPDPAVATWCPDEERIVSRYSSASGSSSTTRMEPPIRRHRLRPWTWSMSSLGVWVPRR